jgi:HK97 family phage portal protein
MPSLLARMRSWLGASPVSARGSGGWLPIVREPYTGAWQANQDILVETVLASPTVFRCCSLIAGDIGKLAPPRLVALDDDGIWTETTSPAFSPVLRSPNRYQTAQQFYESWMWSKLLFGNTYVLKERDNRGLVIALYVLDPTRVQVLVATDGSVYYQLAVNDLAGISSDTGEITVPAREIIHDRWNCAFHPLMGLSPLYACGGAAMQGLNIQRSSTSFFEAGGRPSGLLVAPTEIDPLTAQRLSESWHALGPGKTAVVGFGMKYQDIGSTAVDAQLIDQLGWTAETIAGCFGVPISMIDSSKQPPYANSEASMLQYHAQCLQIHLTAIEVALDTGLELPTPYGTEFDLDMLIWMDTPTKVKAAADAINAGILSPNEARFKTFGLGPVDGGESPMAQQQYFSLKALAKRDAADPFSKPTPAPPAAPPDEPTEEEVAAAVGELTKA